MWVPKEYKIPIAGKVNSQLWMIDIDKEQKVYVPIHNHMSKIHA